MTKFFLIRHGEQDYTPCIERGFEGRSINFAPLTERGCAQALKTAQDPRLKDAQIVVTSPYTRALQTGAIIASELQIPFHVDMDLHEWLPDKTRSMYTQAEVEEANNQYKWLGGEYPDAQSYNWESKEDMRLRMQKILARYCDYNCVIIVSHGRMLGSYTGQLSWSHAAIMTWLE